MLPLPNELWPQRDGTLCSCAISILFGLEFYGQINEAQNTNGYGDKFLWVESWRWWTSSWRARWWMSAFNAAIFFWRCLVLLLWVFQCFNLVFTGWMICFSFIRFLAFWWLVGVFSLGEWCALLTVSMLPFFGLNLHAAIPTGSWGLWPPFPRGGFAPPPFPSPFHPFRPFYPSCGNVHLCCLFVCF